MEIKKSKRIKRRSILILFAVICTAATIVSLVMLLSMTAEYTEGAQSYEELNQYITMPSEDPEYPVSSDSEAEACPVVDFDALRAINPDIVAWLICEDTLINYPVVQGRDNDYYLKHLFDGTRNNAGCLFVDSSNEPDFVDHNTVIYGHHMKDNSMFSVLTEYKTQSFYEEHPQMILLTPEGNYTIDLFAGYVTDVNADSWKLWFSSNAEFEEWLRETRPKSTFMSDVEASTSDRFVTLSTCSYEFDNARYVVVGKLVPIGQVLSQ